MFCTISFTLEASSCAILVVSVGSTRHSCTNTIAGARRRNCWVMKRFFVHQTMLMTDFSVHFLRCYSSVVDDVLGIKNFQLKSTNLSWIPSLPMPNDNGLTIFETNNTRFYDPSYLFSLLDCNLYKFPVNENKTEYREVSLSFESQPRAAVCNFNVHGEL